MSQLADVTCAKALDEAIAALWKCTEKYIQHNDNREDDQEMRRLLHVMQSYCMLDLRSRASANSFVEARMAEPDDRTFRQIYDDIMTQKMKTLDNPKTHPKFKLYKKKIAMLTAKELPGEGQERGEANDDDEELVITQAEVNTIDPITRQQMTSPVKNTICGHSYDKHSITALFRHKKKQKCPYVGCPNKGHFTAEDLEEDFELKQIIKRQLESQAR